VTEKKWNAFRALRDEFRSFCETLSAEHPELREAGTGHLLRCHFSGAVSPTAPLPHGA
jgi:hypothetical protein